MTRGGRSSIFFEIYALGQAVRHYIDEAMAGAPLTPEEYAYYSVIFEDERTTPTEIARRLSIPKTTVMEYVRLMETRGHARRLPHASDGRSYELVLSASGLAAHRRSNTFFEQAYAGFIAQLHGDEARVMRGLSDLRDAVKAANDRDRAAASRSGEAQRRRGQRVE